MRLLVTYSAIFLTYFVFGNDETVASEESFRQGVLSFEKKNYDEARTHFQAAIEREPENLSAYYNLGVTDLEIQNYGEAIWAFEKTLKFDPKNQNAVDGLKRAHLHLDPDFIYLPENTGAVLFFASISPFTWAMIGIFSSLMIGILLILNFTRKSSQQKGLTLIGSVFFLMCLSFSIYGGYQSAESRNNTNSAITLKASQKYHIDLSESDEFIPEGSKLIIKDSIERSFLKVQTTSGEEVILKQDFVKRI